VVEQPSPRPGASPRSSPCCASCPGSRWSSARSCPIRRRQV